MKRDDFVIGFLLGLAIGFLGGVGTANAAPFTPPLNRAYQVANDYWGSEPEGCASIDVQIVPNGSLPDNANGWATVPEPGERVPCVLYLVRKLAKPSNWTMACAVMIHEAGHLRGFEHSEDPANVMYDSTLRPPNICWRISLRLLNARHR